MVLLDDRTEEQKSFSVARVLIDSFQWEIIHEWVSLRVEDRVFDIFAKEFSYESYSTESHPNLGDNFLESSQDRSGVPRSMMEVLPTYSRTGSEGTDVISKNDNVGDPLIEVIINERLENVLEFNCGNINVGEEDGKSGADLLGVSMVEGQCFIRGVRRELLDFDPVVCEAQIACNKNKSPLAVKIGPEKLALISKELDYRITSPLVDDPFEPGVGVTNAVAVGWVDDWVPLSDYVNVVPISQFAPIVPTVVGVWGDTASASCSDSVREGKELACDSAVGDTGHSGESLYRINYEALQWERSSVNFSGVDVTVNEQSGAEVNQKCGGVEGEDEDEEYSDDTLYLINEANVDNFINGELLEERALPLVGGAVNEDDEFESAAPNTVDLADLGEEGEDIDEIENYEEDNCLTDAKDADEAKKVWSKVGLSFYSSNEEEVLNRVAEKKLVSKKRGEMKQKRQKQGRKISCIEGRTLATRTLRLVSKSKLK
ncbi:hypothetical protein PIB30_033215 [Stylosanthes scabra]|uniref:Uncharacterized protein n=1 Tax=Stylosanthes scabra TaxID=79078 RepID=A0ABU6TC65_9FABA|nr:hypothetical protein [Stylosanthes scabra]